MIRKKLRDCFPSLVRFVRWARKRKIELFALPRHLSRKRLLRKRLHGDNNKPITVVFMCQYIPAWSKNKAFYDSLRADTRFHPILLCVPNRVSANHLTDVDDLSNDCYDYFISHGHPEAINALIGKDTWFDLKAIHPDYVIYNRYDRPMPLPYTSTAVSKFSKVCLIIYGCSLLKVEEKMIHEPFASNTFCFFAESEGIRRSFLSMNSLLEKLGLSRAVCCGIPAIENAYKAKNGPCPAWDFSKNQFRVIYAPRWTTDPTWGGSSFIQYKETFFQIADKIPDIDILVRPHPLMFDNFIRTGLLSREDVENYRQSCMSRSNIRLDQEKEYLTTFWNADVLICDYSSMMIEYYITGKPIIYLTYRDSIDYTDQMRAMLSGCYIVNDEYELQTTLKQLIDGNDPLSPRRLAVCKEELIGEENISASDNMKQLFLDCYRK